MFGLGPNVELVCGDCDWRVSWIVDSQEPKTVVTIGGPALLLPCPKCWAERNGYVKAATGPAEGN